MSLASRRRGRDRDRLAAIGDHDLAPLADLAVIATFAKILEFPIDVAPELAAEKVSIELQSVPARDALTALLELVDAELVESSTAPRRLAVRKRG